MDNGTYRCEKCNQDYPNFNYRLMLAPQIADWTGTQRVSLFHEQAELLLGASADEIGPSKEGPSGVYESHFRGPLFKWFTFRIGAKMENYNVSTAHAVSMAYIKR